MPTMLHVVVAKVHIHVIQPQELAAFLDRAVVPSLSNLGFLRRLHHSLSATIGAILIPGLLFLFNQICILYIIVEDN
jgi:hypothetical protein